MVRVFQSHTVTLDGFHHLVNGSILGNDNPLQIGIHVLQADSLCFLHTLYRDTCHHGDNTGNVLLADFNLFVSISFLPFLLFILQGLLKLRLSVTEAGGQFKVLVLHRSLLLLLRRLNLLLNIQNCLWNLHMLQMYT